MGFLDKAKKLAEQAMSEIKQQTDRARHPETTPAPGPTTAPADPLFGTPYREGMLGRPGWRERGLTDPAEILPIRDRDQAGIPHSVKSVIVAEPFGVGRRWTSGNRSAGLFYRLDPDHQAYDAQSTDDGRALTYIADVVLETKGLDEGAVAALTSAVRRTTSAS